MPPSSFLYVLRRLLRTARGGSRHVRAAAWAAVFTAPFPLVGSWLIVPVEEGAPRATITTFPRALWWSIETATTVGYGGFFPVTAAGRVIAVVLILVAIAAFSIVTAALATWFVDAAGADVRRLAADANRLENRAKSKAADELHSLHDRFDHMEQLLKTSGPTGRTP